MAALVEGLRRAMTDRNLSLLAVDAGRVEGHVMLTASLLDAPRRLVDVQVVSPVAMVPDRLVAGSAPRPTWHRRFSAASGLSTC